MTMNGMANGRMNDMTQTDRVLQYMQMNGSITQNEASDVIRPRITNLAGRIYDLQKRGTPIKRRTEYGENEYGKYHYTRYMLEA